MGIAVLQKGFQGLVKKVRNSELDKRVFGEKVGITASLFGCWHENLSRPFNEERTSYRACLKCGARKPFNPETLRTEESFYYPPIVREVRL